MIPADAELHIYNQYVWHDPAYIVGTREALELLLKAVQSALNNGKDKFDVYAGDGEDYDVHIIVVSDKEMATLRTPYSAEYAQETRHDSVHPFELVKEKDD